MQSFVGADTVVLHQIGSNSSYFIAKELRMKIVYTTSVKL
jgi:hypothetical protein